MHIFLHIIFGWNYWWDLYSRQFSNPRVYNPSYIVNDAYNRRVTEYLLPISSYICYITFLPISWFLIWLFSWNILNKHVSINVEIFLIWGITFWCQYCENRLSNCILVKFKIINVSSVILFECLLCRHPSSLVYSVSSLRRESIRA